MDFVVGERALGAVANDDDDDDDKVGDDGPTILLLVFVSAGSKIILMINKFAKCSVSSIRELSMENGYVRR